ncbi:MAG: hypothetical protein ACRBB3_02285 [Alphaproteobacteria bacterium]
MSETSKNSGLHANENVKWYILGGKSKDAILRSIEINKDQDSANKSEVSELSGTLGLKFLVARSDKYYGYSAHCPEIYASPIPNENEFYMMCPIGDGRKDGKTSFVPEDAKEISDKKVEQITSMLFGAWTSSTPIIRKDPIPLQENTLD